MAHSEWDALALEKLTKVLGRQQAEEVMRRALSVLGLTSMASAQDLYLFGQQVISEKGFAGAVGALLSTMAVLRGASPPDASSAAPDAQKAPPARQPGPRQAPPE